MTGWPDGTTVVGAEPDGLAPRYMVAVMAAVDRLRSFGVEPAQVVIPGPPPEGDPMLHTFYGIPVLYAPGADMVQLVVDVVQIRGSGQ